MNHAKIGPSSLARVIRCPGSVRESEGAPNITTEFAAEGTVLHEIAANCLEFGFEPEDWVGLTMSCDGFDFEITDDLVSCMYRGLDWLREQSGEFYVEKRVDLTYWMPEQFGTCDVGIWQPDLDRVLIYDWKFGAGVPVQPHGNEQARAYALGFVASYLWPRGIRPKNVRIVIEQPRCPGGGTLAEPWDISFDDLLEFGGVMRHTYVQANDPHAPLIPGPKQCQFCPAKERTPAPGDMTGCHAYDAHMLDLFDSKFEDLDGDDPITPPTNLTPLRRAKIVREAKTLEKWLALLHEQSIQAAEMGQPDPGMKLVAGRRGHRRWTREKRAELILKIILHEDRFTRKLKSPAQAETSFRKVRSPRADRAMALLHKLIKQDEGKPVLVDTSDDRDPLPTVVDAFDDL